MDLQKLRNKMVDDQIVARGISDLAVLEALRRVPRHEFVPRAAAGLAYQDCPAAIGDGQTISQPYMVALMTQCLRLKKSDRVFEVGTGSGYQTAVLAELCADVYSIERIEALFNRAKDILKKLNYTNIKTFLGDGTLGLPGAPLKFDAIIVTAASPCRPDELLLQLAPGGRLVIPIGDRQSQMLTSYTNEKGLITETAVCGCTFVPLIGAHGWSLSN